jgi:hypothetical protein
MTKNKRKQIGAWSWNSEILWSKIEQKEADDCWTWLGATGPHANLFGTKKNGRPQMSQLPRILYRDVTGLDCEGMEITHTCNNRYCANFSHLMALPLKSGRPPKAIEEKRKLQQGTLTVIDWIKL